MRVTWDPAKAVENLRKHGVDFAEAASVVDDPFAIRVEDPIHDELRFVALGTAFSGHLFVVVYAYHGDEDIRIISARAASRAERRRYADEPR
jgi:uncharacterized DUF497 family protein